MVLVDNVPDGVEFGFVLAVPFSLGCLRGKPGGQLAVHLLLGEICRDERRKKEVRQNNDG